MIMFSQIGQREVKFNDQTKALKKLQFLAHQELPDLSKKDHSPSKMPDQVITVNQITLSHNQELNKIIQNECQLSNSQKHQKTKSKAQSSVKNHSYHNSHQKCMKTHEIQKTPLNYTHEPKSQLDLLLEKIAYKNQYKVN